MIVQLVCSYLGRLGLLLLLATVAVAEEKRVVAEGLGPGDQANGRQIALTDALREAVNIGAGVQLNARSEVRDFMLAEDTVFTQAIGYVRDYSILEQGLGTDGIYRVKIAATVGTEIVGIDEMALRMLVKRKGSPRVLIEIQTNLRNLPDQPDLSTAMQELALSYELELVDPKSAAQRQTGRGRRDALVHGVDTGEARALSLPQHDFLVHITIGGSYNGRKNVGGLNLHGFSLAVDLKAVWPDTGETVVAVSLPAIDIHSHRGSPAVAARDAIERLLLGQKGTVGPKSAKALFHSILMRWITELDLGRRRQLEFKAIERGEFDKLLLSLQQTPNIGAVWERSFDSELYSLLTVESRLETAALIEQVARVLPAWKVTASRSGSIHFEHTDAQAQRQLERASPKSRNSGDTEISGTNGVPVWVWALIGAVAMLVIVRVFHSAHGTGEKAE